MFESLIALGSNLGPREPTLDRAVERLRELQGVSRVVASRWFATEPIGGPADQPAFLNGAARLTTTLTAEELHPKLKELETELGRQSGERWGPRALDLDLLLHGVEQVETPALRVPHPRMAVRKFVLEPAAEIAADMVHPEIGWTVGRLWEHLQTAPPYLALAGADAESRRALVEQLAAQGACQAMHLNLPAGADPMARAVELLTGCSPGPCDAWVVSDFWLEELAEQAAKRKTMAAALAPKLVVVLGDVSEPAERIERLARRPGRGPTLTVDATRPQAAIHEIAAALAAMRP